MTPFEILGVAHNASKDQIKTAYRNACKKHHPDAGGDIEHFKKVQEAYEQLAGDISDEWNKLLHSMIEKAYSDGSLMILDKIVEQLEQELYTYKISLRALERHYDAHRRKCSKISNHYKHDPFLVRSLNVILEKALTDHKDMEQRIEITERALDFFKPKVPTTSQPFYINYTTT